MKPYAWVVRQGNLPYLCYSKEEALRYHKHIGSKEPIAELYERTTHCVKESFDAGYAKALQDVKVLSEAVELLRDFAGSVGGSSSFWEEVYNDDFECRVWDAQNIIKTKAKS